MNYRSQLKDENRLVYEFTLFQRLFSRQVYLVIGFTANDIIQGCDRITTFLQLHRQSWRVDRSIQSKFPKDSKLKILYNCLRKL